MNTPLAKRRALAVRNAMAFAAALTMSACAHAPPLLGFEHGDTLTQSDYQTLEQIVATASAPLEAGKPEPAQRAMPQRVYLCDPALALPRDLIVRIGSFTGRTDDEQFVARYLPDRLEAALTNAHLFDKVTREPGPDGAALSGTVTRTSSLPGYKTDFVAAQVEARLELSSREACAFQLNVIGRNAGYSIASLIAAGLEGDRASMVSDQIVATLSDVQKGQTRGIYAGRYGMLTRSVDEKRIAVPASNDPSGR